MKLLIVHSNFPAQFDNLATVMGQLPEHEVIFLTQNPEYELPGVKKVLYGNPGKENAELHFCLRNTDLAMRHGREVYMAAAKLKDQGFYPDVMLAHSGWGPAMFLKDIFPKAQLVGYFEWFNRAHGTTHDFLQGPSFDLNKENAIRVANVPLLVDLYSSDAGLTPTQWQKAQFPVEYQEKIRVIHEGVRTETYQPALGAKLVLPEINLDLSHVDELVTYVGRGMESYRGFPQFMQALARVLRERPKAHAVIVGPDRIAYGGPKAPNGKTYKEWALSELDLDLSRVHFTGLLPRYQYRQVLQASSVHVYLTIPFVLSWSMLEAMSCGCLLVASNTQPVQEVIAHNQNGLLVDFFDHQALAKQICDALENQTSYAPLRANARKTIEEKYSWRKTVPETIAYLKSLL